MSRPVLPARFRPERIVAQGTVKGIHWMTAEAPIYGAVNGYAYVPPGHPWSDLNYDNISTDAPGGLTFESGGWIGFDTLHGGDIWPGMPEAIVNLYKGDSNATFWTPGMVEQEARNLARAIAEAGDL